jgi:Ran GTPase-activating protein (RanGAP) involved in mRNA processing and transport
MKSFHNLIATCKGLVTLSLRNCNLHDTACQQLFKKAFTLTKRLEKVDLSHNQITDTGCIAISEGLQCGISVKQLNLSSNMISQPGAEEVFASLVDNSNVTSISLNDNKLSDAFAVWLCRFLKTLRDEYSSCQLTEVSLNSNGILKGL